MSFRSTLSQWDHPTWHTEHHHSAVIARVFEDVHIALASHSRDRAAYLRTYNALSRLLGMSMSARQREHLFYLLGMCAAADSKYELARVFLDDALELALRLDEWGDACVIRVLRASVHRAVSRMGMAATDMRDNIFAWNDYAERSGKSIGEFVDPALRVGAYSLLSGYAFFEADYAGAQEALDQGRALLPLVADHALHEATLDWTQALLYRLQRRPDLALEYASRANVVYMRQSSALSQIRLQYLIAETALDCAELVPSGGYRQTLIEEEALPALHFAARLAREINDDSGTGMMLLTRARTSRLLGRDEVRELQIESVTHLARRIDDDALLASAYTALGDEYASQGKLSQALSAYRNTLWALDGAEAVAMKLPARIMIERIEASGVRQE